MKNQTLLDLPPRPPSEHEATGMADLIEPFQIEVIKDFCKWLKTTPQFETAALFGDGVSFYRLSQKAADSLTVALAESYRRTNGKMDGAPD